MGNFGAFLVALAGPVARRVLASLGLGMVSYAGLALVAQQVVDMVTAQYNSLGGQVVQLLNLIGFGQAVGIVLGGLVARVAYGAISKIGAMSA